MILQSALQYAETHLRTNSCFLLEDINQADQVSKIPSKLCVCACAHRL